MTLSLPPESLLRTFGTEAGEQVLDGDAPFLPLAQATPWCALEYAKPDPSMSVAAVFRTSCDAAGDEPDVFLLRPRGIDPAATYDVRFDSAELRFTAAGETLLRDGRRIRLEQPQTSELVELQRVSRTHGATA